MGFEEIDGEDDIREEFPCPFCSEYFDIIIGLCRGEEWGITRLFLHELNVLIFILCLLFAF